MRGFKPMFATAQLFKLAARSCERRRFVQCRASEIENLIGADERSRPEFDSPTKRPWLGKDCRKLTRASGLAARL